MPILDDIMDHKVFGPAIRQGQHEGAVRMLRRQITARFGPPSQSIEDRLSKMSVAELEDLGVRIMHVSTLTGLFRRKKR